MGGGRTYPVVHSPSEANTTCGGAKLVILLRKCRFMGLVSILFGLAPQDEVVVTQGFALKSEVLKARLGASCADH